MKNEFMGVLEAKKGDLKMGEKKNKNNTSIMPSLTMSKVDILTPRSSSRPCGQASVRDIAGVASKRPIPRTETLRGDGLCLITTIPSVALNECGCGSHAVIKQGNSFFNKRQGSKIRSQVQDDFVLFTTTTSGFTLIELLVVVLIIGILAAVALPQYRVAVEKTRAIQAVGMLRTLYNAQQAYYLANGTYTNDLEKLDVDIAIPKGFRVTENGVYMIVLESENSIFYTMNLVYSRGVGYCYALKRDSQGVAICRSLGQEYASDDEYVRYSFFVN